VEEPARVTPLGRPGRCVLGVALCAGVTLTLAEGGEAQDTPAAPPTAADSVPPPLDVSPGGAFLRSVLVPGWGHAAIGSFSRGGFYFAMETGTWYTLIRTRGRLSEALERVAFRESVARANLADEGITDPAEIESRLEQDAGLQAAEDLVRSRERQQEDLVAFGIFLLLLSGADAYVSAHLARFPVPIDVEAGPTGDGRVEVALRLKLPR